MSPADPRPHLISQVEYARRHGWSKQYIGQLVAKGRITLIGGMVDPEAADAALAAQHDPGRAARWRGDRIRDDDETPVASGPLQGSFAKARTVREHFRAMREKLEYEQAAGSLIARALIERVLLEAGRLVRDEVLLAADPAAAALAVRFPEIDAAEAERIITAHITAAFHAASAQLSTQGGAISTRPLAGEAPPAASKPERTDRA